MQSAVLILPTELKTQGDVIGQVMGWGPESYTIPLSNNNSEVTHYALRADVDKQFVRWITGVDPLPLPQAEIVLKELIYDFSGIDHQLWGREHLEYLCNKHGFTLMR